MPSIAQLLNFGDKRTTGKVDQVVELVKGSPQKFPHVFEAMKSPNPAVRMRAADAVVKLSTDNPKLLEPYKDVLLNKISKVEQPEVRWHLAEMLTLVDLNPAEQAKAIKIMLHNLKTTQSRIVMAFSLQAIADIALKNPAYLPILIQELKTAAKSDVFALASRARILIKKHKIEL